MTQTLVSAPTHEVLLQLGFNWASEEELYVTSAEVEQKDTKQPVFLAPRNGKLLILAWIGERKELEPAYLESARRRADGYDIEILYQIYAFCDASTTIAEAESNLAEFIARVFTLANYTTRVNEKITQNMARFDELLAQWNPFFKDSESLLHSQAPQVIDLLRETLNLRPRQDIWSDLLGAVSGFEQYQWAIGIEETFTNQPWSPVRSFLEEYGAARGWKLG